MRRIELLLALSLVITVLPGLVGCGGSASGSQTSASGGGAPALSLTVTPASITAGQMVTLAWTSNDASSVTINPGVGQVAANGSMQITPTTTTSFTATATGQAGTPLVATATVTVSSATVSSGASILGPVVVVAFENHAYASVVGSPAMPYLNGLINTYSLAENFYAAAPGSVPDYFMLTTGTKVACCPSYAGPYTGNNLARVLIAGGKSWKAYVQSIPHAGYVGKGGEPYVKYHNPFAYFSDVLNSPAQLANIVPLSELATDISGNTLPDFSFVVPDNYHNAHTCPGGGKCADTVRLKAADTFLQTYLQSLLSAPAFQSKGLLVIWWDEGDDTTEHTAITFVGPLVQKGYRSTTHYMDQDLLRTIIDGFGLSSYPGASASAEEMNDMLTVPFP